ncbi:MAG: hypothetical protein Q8P61_03580 [Candidatus Nanopelagicales bacterium]|nr:hypothetical protein [Candidatus Nanopelagicales bacterium]
MAVIELAGVHQIDGVWPQVSDGFEKACRKTGGSLDAPYLWAETRAGRAFLIVVSEDSAVIAASVWRFENWASGRKLNCLALHGRAMTEWLQQHREFVTAMAKAGGATALVADGRVGWARTFPDAKLIRQTCEIQLS